MFFSIKPPFSGYSNMLNEVKTNKKSQILNKREFNEHTQYSLNLRASFLDYR